MELEEIYAKVGGDYQDAIAKYGSNDKIARYLKILLKGTAAEELGQALDANDAQAAFAAGHNLKGTTANMSLTRIAELFTQITEDARAGNTSEASKQAYTEAKALYDWLANEVSAL